IRYFPPQIIEEEYYKNMLMRIGFQRVTAERKTERLQFGSDEEHLDTLMKFTRMYFFFPPELMEECKRQALKVLADLKERDSNYYTCYIMYLFAFKPNYDI
ncbi:hypothetical protein NPIL_277732, partial [Nephila pilipes]